MKRPRMDFLTLMPLLLLAACLPVNGTKKAQPRSKLPLPGASAVTSSATTATIPTLTITGAEELQPSNEERLLRIYFKEPQGTGLLSNPISTFCAATPEDAACQCVFLWTENNTTTPGSTVTSESLSISYQRKAISSVVKSQQALAECRLPSVYRSEISVGEKIRVSIEPVSIERTPFRTTEFTFEKKDPAVTPTTGASSFVDDRGNRFQDVWRYVCHEFINHPGAIRSEIRAETFSVSGPDVSHEERVSYAYASIFSREQRPGLSAQLNYFSLYRPRNQLELYQDNASFSCPVIESGSIRKNLGDFGKAPHLFPFDSSFALADRASKTFNTPVEARSRLGSSVNNRMSYPCSGPATSLDNPDSNIAIDCIGYAASPGADGTCPIINVRQRDAEGKFRLDASGNIITEPRRTFRLRRYNALYPALYDWRGAWIANYQAKLDQIYVLDRPAQFSNGITGSILGPKPCPFAWYDRAGSGYHSTNDGYWKGRNPDGIQLPTLDIQGSSCPAIIPKRKSLSPGSTAVFEILSLTSSSQERWIRPVRNAWAPEYWEDTSFRACAPEDEPSTRVRAPIHHFSNGSDAAYCEEIYPTEHNGKATGHGTSELAQMPPVQNGDHYPLLAFEEYINVALQNTHSYRCHATYAPGTSLASGKGYSSHEGRALCCRNAPESPQSSHAAESGLSRCAPM